METCGGCGVARYCSREHQELSFNKKTTRLHTFSHKVMCPLWKRGRRIKKGKETAEDCRQYFLDFLASLNTLTVDGKKRQEGSEVVGGGKSIPRMMSPGEVYVGGSAGGETGHAPDSAVSQTAANLTSLAARARAPPAPTSTGELALGDKVQIHELHRALELNGVLGEGEIVAAPESLPLSSGACGATGTISKSLEEIVSPLDRGAGRWGVRADSDGRVLAMVALLGIVIATVCVQRS